MSFVQNFKPIGQGIFVPVFIRKLSDVENYAQIWYIVDYDHPE